MPQSHFILLIVGLLSSAFAQQQQQGHQRFEFRVFQPQDFVRGNSRQFSFKTPTSFQRQTIFVSPVQENKDNRQQSQGRFIPQEPARTFQPPPPQQRQQQDFQQPPPQQFRNENVIFEAPQFEDTPVVNNFQPQIPQPPPPPPPQRQEQFQEPLTSEPPRNSIAPIPKKSVVAESCLACICQATTGCNLNHKCINGGKYCGPFLISNPYWLDAGRPTLLGDDPDSPGAPERCMEDPVCSANIVEKYMERYAQDCNQDSIIDCEDFGRIHYMGPVSCANPSIFRTPYYQRFRSCLTRIAQLNG